MKIRHAAAILFVLTPLALVAPHWSAVAPAQDQIDLNAVFRCKATDDDGKAKCTEGRELIMAHCNTCHLFVKLVRYQADAAKWDSVMARMRPRAPRLTDEQAKVLRDYVVENFGEDQPPPDLPQALLDAAV